MKTRFSFLGELHRLSFSLSSLWKYCSRGGLLVTTGCSVRPLHITLQISSSQGQSGEEGRGNRVPLLLKLTETVFHSYTLQLIIPDPSCRIRARRLRIQAHLFFELTWESPPTQKLLRLTNADTKPPLFSVPSNRKWEAWHVFHIAAFYGGWECFKITHPITQGPLEMIIPVDEPRNDCGLRPGRSNPRWRTNIYCILEKYERKNRFWKQCHTWHARTTPSHKSPVNLIHDTWIDLFDR